MPRPSLGLISGSSPRLGADPDAGAKKPDGADRQRPDERLLRYGFEMCIATFSSCAGLFEGYTLGLGVDGTTMGLNNTLTEVIGLTDMDEPLRSYNYYLIGAITGSACAGLLADAVGRRSAIMIASVIAIGSSITALLWSDLNSVGLYAARGLSGMATGIFSTVVVRCRPNQTRWCCVPCFHSVPLLHIPAHSSFALRAVRWQPLYISELAPPRMRGQLIATYQVAITVGILAAYINIEVLILHDLKPYIEHGQGVLKESISTTFVKPSAKVGELMFLEIIPACFTLVGMFFMPESPRWHMLRGDDVAARRTIVHIRRGQSLSVLRELSEMRAYGLANVGLLGTRSPKRLAARQLATRIIGARGCEAHEADREHGPSAASEHLLTETDHIEERPGSALAMQERRRICLAMLLHGCQSLCGANVIFNGHNPFTKGLSFESFIGIGLVNTLFTIPSAVGRSPDRQTNARLWPVNLCPAIPIQPSRPSHSPCPVLAVAD